MTVHVPHMESRLDAVIPAKAGFHVALLLKSKVDSRFRGNDGEGRVGTASTTNSSNKKAIWS